MITSLKSLGLALYLLLRLIPNLKLCFSSSSSVRDYSIRNWYFLTENKMNLCLLLNFVKQSIEKLLDRGFLMKCRKGQNQIYDNGQLARKKNITRSHWKLKMKTRQLADARENNSDQVASSFKLRVQVWARLLRRSRVSHAFWVSQLGACIHNKAKPKRSWYTSEIQMKIALWFCINSV